MDHYAAAHGGAPASSSMPSSGRSPLDSPELQTGSAAAGFPEAHPAKPAPVQPHPGPSLGHADLSLGWPLPPYPPPASSYLFSSFSYSSLSTPELRPDVGSPIEYHGGPPMGRPMALPVSRDHQDGAYAALLRPHPYQSVPPTPLNPLVPMSNPYIATSPSVDYFPNLPQVAYQAWPPPPPSYYPFPTQPSYLPSAYSSTSHESSLPPLTPFSTASSPAALQALTAPPSLSGSSSASSLSPPPVASTSRPPPIPETIAPASLLPEPEAAAPKPAPPEPEAELPRAIRRTTSTKGKAPAKAQAADKDKGKKSGKRVAKEVHVACQTCRQPFAKLIRRGTPAELDAPHSFAFVCNSCAINDSSLDQLALNASASVPRPKRGRSNDKSADGTVCDVCHKTIGVGGCTMDDPLAEPAFTTEIICDHCNDTYKRCTDCGAGGGKRVGAGKWRARQLFENERKTCSLMHFRQSSLMELENVVCRVAELDPAELPLLSELCLRVWVQNQLSNFAIPEIMEAEDASSGLYPMTSYEAIRGNAEGSWRHLSTYIYGMPYVAGAMRYVAVKWCKPMPRKIGLTAPPPPPEPDRSSALLRPGKEFVAFGLTEYDPATGTLFVPVLSPWTNNDGFEPTLDLLEDLLDLVDSQVEDRIQALMKEDRIDEAQAIPRVTHVFTTVPYSKDSRFRTYMEKKRNFMPLAKYLARDPSIPPELFPPHRIIHVPPQALGAFVTLAKGYVPNRDKQSSKARMAKGRSSTS